MDLGHSGVRPLTPSDFEAVRKLAYSACGIILQPQKQALVSSRLERLVHDHGFRSYGDYIDFIAHRRHCPEFTGFIDALTTNHSGFLREPEHFAFLQKTIFPVFRNQIRIWSAACATGEEPYTIAMCALDAGLTACRIAASDISREALDVAIRGIYGMTRTAAVPERWRDRYFTAVGERDGRSEDRSIAKSVRSMVRYEPLNLLRPFHQAGQFEVIFCRNAMIYFDQGTRDDLVSRLSDRLTEGGYLLTGHSETLLHLPPSLAYVQPAVYIKAR